MEKAFLRKELYLSFLLDRGTGQIGIVSSEKGGGNFEEVEENKICKAFFPESKDVPHDALDRVVASFKVSEDAEIQLREIVRKLYRVFIECDATLLEINPIGINI